MTYFTANPSAIYCRLLELRLQALRSYSESVELSFGRDLRELDERSKRLPEEMREDYWDWVYDDLARARDDGPQLLRSTILAAAYSAYEHSLAGLCDVAKGAVQSDVEPPKRHVRSAKKCREYLATQLGLTLKDDDGWGHVDRYRLLRNCITHQRGHVPERPSSKIQYDGKKFAAAVNELNDAVDASPGVTLDDRRHLSLTADAIDAAATACEGHLQTLVGAVPW